MRPKVSPEGLRRERAEKARLARIGLDHDALVERVLKGEGESVLTEIEAAVRRAGRPGRPVSAGGGRR